MFIAKDVHYRINCFLVENNYRFDMYGYLAYNPAPIASIDSVMQEIQSALEASSLVVHQNSGVPMPVSVTKYSESAILL